MRPWRLRLASERKWHGHYTPDEDQVNHSITTLLPQVLWSFSLNVCLTSVKADSLRC
jgi:hypothetical protein